MMVNTGDVATSYLSPGRPLDGRSIPFEVSHAHLSASRAPMDSGLGQSAACGAYLCSGGAQTQRVFQYNLFELTKMCGGDQRLRRIIPQQRQLLQGWYHRRQFAKKCAGAVNCDGTVALTREATTVVLRAPAAAIHPVVWTVNATVPVALAAVPMV